MEYLLKVSAILILFYLSYKLLLQGTTFFNKNRWFLLMGLLTAFIFPLIVIPIYIESTPVFSPEIVAETNFEPIPNLKPFLDSETTREFEKPFNIIEYLLIIYGLGVLFFSIKFISELFSLRLIILKNKPKRVNGFYFCETSDNIPPFSFFRWIIYNPNNYSKIELQQILTHEKIHASQKHTLDILITQITCILLWFNPFIWLYSRAIKQNLEFIADQLTQEKISSKSSYQNLLVKTSISKNQFSVANTFYSSLIKKRIVMLNKSKSKRVHLIKYTIVLPLLAIFFMNFNTREFYINTNGDSLKANSITKNETEEFLIYSNFSEVKMQKIVAELKTKGFEFILNELDRNDEDQITSIDFEIKKNGAIGKYGIKTGQPLKAIVIKYYKIENKFSIKTLELINHELLISKSKNVVEILIGGDKNIKYLDSKKIELKEKYNIDFTYEIIEKSSNNYEPNFSFTFNNGIRGIGPVSGLPLKEKGVLKYDTKTKLFVFGKIKENGDLSAQFSILLDIPISYGIKKYYKDEYFTNVIDYYKKYNVILKFTNIKRNEKNEIIAININAKNKKGEMTNFSIDNKNPIEDISINYFENSDLIEFKQEKVRYFKNPIYFLNGKEIKKKEAKRIIKSDNYSKVFLSPEKALEKYGEKGTNGALEITTKKEK